MATRYSISVILLVCSVLLTFNILGPQVVNAQPISPTNTYGNEGLIPCNGPDCNACHVVELANRVMNFLITIMSIIGVLVMVIAGFKMVTSGGNTASWESGKKMFGSVVIGIILVLAAWLIVDTILKILTEEGGLEPWSKIECVDTKSK